MLSRRKANGGCRLIEPSNPTQNPLKLPSLQCVGGVTECLIIGRFRALGETYELQEEEPLHSNFGYRHTRRSVRKCPLVLSKSRDTAIQ